MTVTLGSKAYGDDMFGKRLLYLFLAFSFCCKLNSRFAVN